MKTKFLALAVLVVAAVGAFAFKAESVKFRGQLWQLNNLSTPHNPAAYTLATINPAVDCPSQSKICVIDIPATDIIPAGQPNAGKPNVAFDNPVSSTDLFDDIQAALLSPADGVSQNGRVIYERN